jgi:hypothetical protein
MVFSGVDGTLATESTSWAVEPTSAHLRRVELLRVFSDHDGVQNRRTAAQPSAR